MLAMCYQAYKDYISQEQYIKSKKSLYILISIVNYSLKLENVLIDKDGYCKLSDLGLSFMTHDNNSIQSI